MYFSDYGYSTNGGNIGRNECFNIFFYSEINDKYWGNKYSEYNTECNGNDWLSKVSNLNLWSINQDHFYNRVSVLNTSGLGNYYSARGLSNVYPTIYLKTNVTIFNGNGDIESPYQLTLNE